VLVTLREWYTALPERDKAPVRHAMRLLAYGALFGIFAIIDGVSQVDDPPHGELKLTYVGLDRTEHPLSGMGPDRTSCTPFAPLRSSPTPSPCPSSSYGLKRSEPSRPLGSSDRLSS
jgi:hypothetical protein